MDADIGCGDAITFGKPEGADESECHLFTSTCMPEGWVPCTEYYSDEACPEAECAGEFAGTGPGCCESPDGDTTYASPATCEDGEWTCEGAEEDVCSCAGSPPTFDCVTRCEVGATVMLPICIYGDHWECPSDYVRSDSCGDSAE